MFTLLLCLCVWARVPFACAQNNMYMQNEKNAPVVLDCQCDRRDVELCMQCISSGITTNIAVDVPVKMRYPSKETCQE